MAVGIAVANSILLLSFAERSRLEQHQTSLEAGREGAASRLRLALWRALAVVGPGDTRLDHMDFDHLAARAETQHAQVEEQRLEAARMILRAVQG